MAASGIGAAGQVIELRQAENDPDQACLCPEAEWGK